jgi:uncharacterized NAD(P)/FAD-binding protein YdhS
VTNSHRLANRILSATEADHLSANEISGQVLIVGTGLTAIDLVRQFSQNPEVTLTLLSRHGLLPHTHEKSPAPASDFPLLSGLDPLQLLKAIRKARTDSNLTWPSIADSVRGQAQKIWNTWTHAEKSQFLRHLRHYWEVIRHRLPISVSEEVEELRKSGRMTIRSGRILEIRESSSQYHVTSFDRENHRTCEMQFDWIILATGSRISQSLAHNSEVPGLTICPFGYGYVSRDITNLYVIGPSSKAVHWEITAVPEIRRQAESVANQIRQNPSRFRSPILEIGDLNVSGVTI